MGTPDLVDRLRGQDAPKEQPPARSAESALWDELDEERPEALKMEPGDKFVGRFHSIEHGETDFGRHPIVILVDQDGVKRALWLLHSALMSQFKKAAPRPGELVGVKRLGQRKSGAGRDYQDWLVKVDRSAQPVSWGDVEDPEAAGDAFAAEPPPF